MSFGGPNPWTDDRVARLKELVRDGVSYSIIAAKLGGGLSRNACIGKARRLGIADDRRPGFNHRKHTPRAKVSGKSAAIAPTAPRRQNNAVPAPQGEPIKFLSRRSGQCSWPLWDGGTPLAEMECCGNPCPPEPDSQNCELHAARSRSSGTP